MCSHTKGKKASSSSPTPVPPQTQDQLWLSDDSLSFQEFSQLCFSFVPAEPVKACVYSTSSFKLRRFQLQSLWKACVLFYPFLFFAQLSCHSCSVLVLAKDRYPFVVWDQQSRIRGPKSSNRELKVCFWVIPELNLHCELQDSQFCHLCLQSTFLRVAETLLETLLSRSGTEGEDKSQSFPVHMALGR